MTKKGNSIFIKRGKTACLLIHGLTSSTQEIEDLAYFLADKDYTVYAPLLPGHNTTFKKLAQTTWQDWYSKVEEAYNSLHGHDLFVIGISMGATLGLHLAAYRKVKALVLLAPAIYYSNPLVKYSSILKFIVPYKKKNYKKHYPHREVATCDIYNEEEVQKRVAYDKASLKALAESIEFIEIVKKELPKIKTPCLIVHSKKDHTIKPDSAQLINDQIGSEQKKLVWLENSAHIISVDNDKEFVFKEVLDFFNENKN